MWAGSTASPGSLLGMSIPRPLLDQPHLWGGTQKCVWTSFSRWPWCTLKYENHRVGAGTVLPPTGWARGQSRYQVLLVWLCHFLGLAGRKPGACFLLPPFCNPAPWGFGRPGGCPSTLSQAAQTSHTMWTKATLPTSLCLNLSHASSSVARPSDPQLEVARARREGRAKQRQGSGAFVSPEDW